MAWSQEPGYLGQRPLALSLPAISFRSISESQGDPTWANSSPLSPSILPRCPSLGIPPGSSLACPVYLLFSPMQGWPPTWDRRGGPREALHHLTWSSPSSGFGKWAQPGKGRTSDGGRQDSGHGRGRAHLPSWFPHPPLQGGSSQQDPRTQPRVHCTLLRTCTPFLHAASRTSEALCTGVTWATTLPSLILSSS